MQKALDYMNALEDIRNFVTGNFYVPADITIEDDTSLLEAGIIDSTGVLEVITFIEETFGITVEDAETLPENLDSISRLAAFVARKRTALD